MRISETGVAVTLRFFEALDACKATKRVRGVNTFTTRHDINRRNFLFVRDHVSTSVLKPEWIVYLCDDCGVSVEWVMFGRGEMFEREK